MTLIKNLKIGIRLSADFGLALVFLVIIASIGVHQMDLLIGQIRYISEVDEAKMKALHKVQFAIGLRGVAARNIVMLSEQGVAASDLELVKSSQKDIDEGLQELHRIMTEQTDSADIERKMLDQLQGMEVKYLAIATKIVNMAVQGQGREARQALVNECMPLLSKVIVHIADFGDLLEQRSQQERTIATEKQGSAKLNLIVMSAIALILGYFLARFTRRSITGPLKEALSVAQRVSKGDLTGRIVAKSQDEVGQLMVALQEMNGSLQRMVKDIYTGTTTLSMLSDTMSNGNRDLSSRTEEQAGSLEETAAAMEELTQTVRVNTEHARQANALVESTSNIALKGSNVVQDVVKTMSGINESSEQIVSIISVIDGIAFQTNILALNAAVEAARAGEQGRGFAVVASEVRTLAQRSSTAAKEIKALIDDSVSRVKKGSELVNVAGSTMQEQTKALAHIVSVFKL